jgi:hypothetical protein
MEQDPVKLTLPPSSSFPSFPSFPLLPPPSPSFHVNVPIDVAFVLILFMQPFLEETVSQPTSRYSDSYTIFTPLFHDVPELQMQEL